MPQESSLNHFFTNTYRGEGQHRVIEEDDRHFCVRCNKILLISQQEEPCPAAGKDPLLVLSRLARNLYREAYFAGGDDSSQRDVNDTTASAQSGVYLKVAEMIEALLQEE